MSEEKLHHLLPGPWQAALKIWRKFYLREGNPVTPGELGLIYVIYKVIVEEVGLKEPSADTNSPEVRRARGAM